MKNVIALILVLFSTVSFAADGYKACDCARKDGKSMGMARAKCTKDTYATTLCVDINKKKYDKYAEEPMFGECALSEKVFCMSMNRTN